MKYYTLANGMRVSAVALGCMRMNNITQAQADTVIETALEQGLNFFDHADIKDKKGRDVMWRIRYALQVLKDDRGIGVVEVILILVVLIGLVIIFKSQLTSLVQTIFEKITSESSGI